MKPQFCSPQPLRPLRLTLGKFMDPLQILKAYPCRTCLSRKETLSQTGETMTTASVSSSTASIQPLQSLVAGTVHYKVGLCTCQRTYLP